MPTGPIGQGIFNALNTLAVPWADENIAGVLDIEYFGNFSGNKITAPMLDRYVDSESGTISAENIATLASVAFALFNKNWGKLWATMEMRYDPIANYDMTETMTDDETVTDYGRTSTRTDNLTHGKTGTEGRQESRTDNLTHGKTGTETETPAVTVNTDDSLYGFNSSSPVPSDKRVQATSGTSTTQYNTQETDTGTVSDTETITHNTQETDTGTVTDASGGQDTQTRNYRLTRTGNIGVTTSQQLIQSERDLWVWNFFYSVVFLDLDRILTIQVY